jgi:alpha-galactosidase
VIKITFIGAGSLVFTRNLCSDILFAPALQDSTLTLMDIDPLRLEQSRQVVQAIVDQRSLPARVEATLDRRAAIRGTDYVITTFQQGGLDAYHLDIEIPQRYGVEQCVGDTLGPGGVFRALRTIPVLLDIGREMDELAADALLLNYVNPMAANCWAFDRGTGRPHVGLCHSVQGTSEMLARWIDVPYDEVAYRSAGINHMAFYLKFERDGENLYPLVQKVIDDGRVPDWNRVRYEMFKRLGYFVTESSEHFSEYVPWFIKRDRPDLIEEFNIPLDEYIRRCEAQIAGWEALRKRMESGDEKIEVRRSHEYGSLIIHSLETGEPRVVYGNVPNYGLIDNLPQGCCVEVPCLVDKNGVQPTKIGSLPPHLAALLQTNVNVQSLTVEAALTCKREHIYHAAMLDPHTAAELDLDQIWHLVDDLIEAHGDWLPRYN